MGCPTRCETIHPVRSRLLGVLALRIARWKHRRASCPLRCSLPSWLGASRVVGGPVPALIVPWQHTPLPRDPKATLDGADHSRIVSGNEGKCHASACGAASAADTMGIGFRRVWHIVVNNVRNRAPHRCRVPRCPWPPGSERPRPGNHRWRPDADAAIGCPAAP